MSNLNAAELIGALSDIDDKIDSANGVLRQLKSERDAIVEKIETLMDEQGTTILAAGGLLCESKYEDVPQIEDWSKLETFVYRQKHLDLFQRRLSPAVWKALLESRNGSAVPGVKVFQKRKLSVRSHKA